MWQDPADADIKTPSAENPELSEVLSFRPVVGEKIALHASPAARDSDFLTPAF